MTIILITKWGPPNSEPLHSLSASHMQATTKENSHNIFQFHLVCSGHNPCRIVLVEAEALSGGHAGALVVHQ